MQWPLPRMLHIVLPRFLASQGIRQISGRAGLSSASCSTIAPAHRRTMMPRTPWARADPGWTPTCIWKICANGPEPFVNYVLRSQRHPLWGRTARARIVAVARELADNVRAKRASGLPWDAHIETNHRRKDFEGSVLTSKRFASGIANGGVAQTPKGAHEANRKSQRARAGQARVGFPIVLRKRSAGFAVARSFARHVLASSGLSRGK